LAPSTKVVCRSDRMSQFLIISVPAEGNPDNAYSRLVSYISKYSGLLASDQHAMTRFSIPVLKVHVWAFLRLCKVGTLDVLVGLSEELAKLDSFTESVTRKLVQYMGEVLEEQRHKLEDNLNVGGVPPHVYVAKFQWDCAKYPTKQTLRALHDILSESQELKKTSAPSHQPTTASRALYSLLKENRRNCFYPHSQTFRCRGSLLTRNLADIVKKQQFILGSEYLTTLVVVVPKPLYGEWKASYETLSDMVVPRSSELIYEDQENGLWTVTLFQKMVNDFTVRAREKKFLPRDFVYDEKKIEESRNAVTKLESDKKRQFPALFRWLKINFGEAFSIMMHVKALRVFVESVLRYGLPVDFESVLLQPNKRNIKKLRDVLQQAYEHLDNLCVSSIKDEEISGPGFTHGEYYPYVSINLETNMIDAH
uniref:V-type proton ATPase subunit C n=1 Tax=Schistocephalus solidus TaxID=70667 RepID=A0A183SS26_SCHSO